MRLSKTAWFILSIGIFIIAFGSLFVGYSRLSGEQEKVQDSLSSAQELLPQLVSEREDSASQLAQLQNQLAQAASSLSDSKAKFPQAVESIEYGEELFMIAHACDLEIFNLTASEPRYQEVEGITYTTTLFEIEVQSKNPPPDPLTKAYIDNTIDNMLAFINTIATEEYFNVADIELVDIVAPQPGETTGERPSATINLIIYTYQGE